MRVILILFLILFMIISSLFLTTFISKISSSFQHMESAAEIPLENESVSIISDIKSDISPDAQGMEEHVQDTGTDAEIDSTAVEEEAGDDEGDDGDDEGDEAPAIELEIFEGPVYSADDGVCYYRIRANVTGTPDPNIVFSKDDSGGAWGSKKVQINLGDPSDTYTLTATATNSEGSAEDTIDLSWGCDEEVGDDDGDDDGDENGPPVIDSVEVVRKLVFKSNRDGNYNIYSINLDGSDWQRLTDNNGDDLYPEVSPDGKKIVYTADISGIWQIMIMDWNGQNKKQITNNNYRCAYPTLSHDIQYIYFEAYLEGDWELFRINSDGSDQIRLTYNSSGHDWHPNAHPFDSKVIFESGMPGHDDIYIMNSDGSAVSRMFSRHERRRTPDLSSDSTKLVYTRYFGDNSEIYYADIRDQIEIRITHNGDWDGHPMFSPDGSLIVYEQRSGGKEDLIIYNIQTGEKTNVTNTGYKDSDACFMYQN